jgi:hypothetical protein
MKKSSTSPRRHGEAEGIDKPIDEKFPEGFKTGIGCENPFQCNDVF